MEPVRGEVEGEEGVHGDDGESESVGEAASQQQQQQQAQSGLVYMNPNGTLGQTPGLRNTKSVDRWIIKGQFDPDWETAEV